MAIAVLRVVSEAYHRLPFSMEMTGVEQPTNRQWRLPKQGPKWKCCLQGPVSPDNWDWRRHCIRYQNLIMMRPLQRTNSILNLGLRSTLLWTVMLKPHTLSTQTQMIPTSSISGFSPISSLKTLRALQVSRISLTYHHHTSIIC